MNTGRIVSLILILEVTVLIKGDQADSAEEKIETALAKASCDFTLDLLKTAKQKNYDNVLLSPTSISILLSMLQQGAEGNTAEQLEKVLHLSAEESKLVYGRVINSFEGEKVNLTLEWANKGYVIPEFELSEAFLKTIEDNFNATIEELDFSSSPLEAATKINEWVKEATHDQISDLVDTSLLTPDLVMIMVNAVFFRSVWDSPFEKFKTRVYNFEITQEKKVQVPFMRQEGRFMAGEDTELGLKWIELPFKPHGLNEVLANISGTNLKNIIEDKGTRQVKLTIPKFKISKKYSLSDSLKELGLTDLFSSEADLKGIGTGNKTLLLSKVIHQADVEIDEEGTKAAAATFDFVQMLSLEWYPDEMLFRADEPFLFFIVDKVTEIPIFAGKIYDPSGSEQL